MAEQYVVSREIVVQAMPTLRAGDDGYIPEEGRAISDEDLRALNDLEEQLSPFAVAMSRAMAKGGRTGKFIFKMIVEPVDG